MRLRQGRLAHESIRRLFKGKAPLLEGMCHLAFRTGWDKDVVREVGGDEEDGAADGQQARTVVLDRLEQDIHARHRQGTCQLEYSLPSI